jgi:hypothetical protein
LLKELDLLNFALDTGDIKQIQRVLKKIVPGYEFVESL